MPPDRSPHSTEPQSSLHSFRRWMIAQALPFWATTGFDQTRGCFHERLFHDGTPDAAAPRRTMVQARQIYVYSQAHQLGWHEGGAELAVRAMVSLQRDFARDADGETSFAYSIDGRGPLPRRSQASTMRAVHCPRSTREMLPAFLLHRISRCDLDRLCDWARSAAPTRGAAVRRATARVVLACTMIHRCGGISHRAIER